MGPKAKLLHFDKPQEILILAVPFCLFSLFITSNQQKMIALNVLFHYFLIVRICMWLLCIIISCLFPFYTQNFSLFSLWAIKFELYLTSCVMHVLNTSKLNIYQLKKILWSWKVSSSDSTGRSCFIPGIHSWKSCTNLTHNPNLKQYISQGLGDWKTYSVCDCTTSGHGGACRVYMCYVSSIYTFLYNMYIYLFIFNAIKMQEKHIHSFWCGSFG